MTRSIHRRFRRALILLGLGFAILTPALGFLATGLHAEPALDEPRAPVQGVRVIHAEPARGYGLERVFTGRVEPFRQSSLGFERAGLLAAVLVRAGDRVESGQVVARLDRALLEAKRSELDAALRKAEADLALAEATLSRYRDSVDQGAVTRQALDEAREGARAAQAALDLARARIASVDIDLAKSELKAPFDGIVIARAADEGRVLGAGEPVVELQEQAVPEVRVGVAGPLVDLLQPGREYRLAWHGSEIPARLRALLPVRSGRSRTVDAIFVPELGEGTSPSAYRAGELVELRLSEWIDAPGFWLPLAAITEGSRGLWSAYAVAADSPDAPSTGRLDPRPLDLIHQAGERVFVQGALATGEPLVAAGLHRVVPGQLVRVLGDAGRAVAALDPEGR